MSVGERDHLGVQDGGVSDSEREAIVRDLTRHCGDGRLTLDELEERIAEAYAATTATELRRALRELPATTLATEAAPAPPRPSTTVATASTQHVRRARPGRGAEIALKAHLYVYLSVIAMLTVIWVLTSGFGSHPWPIWPAVGWGTAVAIQAGITKAICEGDHDRHR